ncbi:hypothetical protein PV325_008385, partial [Microctonus aethiopoides]
TIMDIVIKTGFAKITHAIPFQLETPKKGKALAEAGRVLEVVEHRNNNNRKLSKSIATVSTTKVLKCKHVAALIFFVNNEKSIIKTSEEQQWDKPSAKKLAQTKYCNGKYFYEMFPDTAPSQPFTPFPPQLHELTRPSHLQQVLYVKAQDRVEFAIKSLMSSLLDEIEKQELKEKNNLNIEACLEQFIIFSSQSEDPQWFEVRRLRISASTNVHSIKTREKKTIESLIADFLSPKKFNNGATKYGKKNESIARSLYEQFLDGVVIRDGNIDKLVEIKCPEKCKNQPIIDVNSKIPNVNYLDKETHELKESYVYYSQSQIQMYATGMDVCHLFLYSGIQNGSYAVEVLRDEEFIKHVILKSEEFYFLHLLPALCALHKKEKSVSHKPNADINNNFTGIDISNTYLQ